MYIFIYTGSHLHFDIEVRTDLMKEHIPSPQCWVLAPEMLEFWCSHELCISLQQTASFGIINNTANKENISHLLESK